MAYPWRLRSRDWIASDEYTLASRRRRVPTTLLLLTLTQFSGLSQWTDAQGVVHVDLTSHAPASATVLEGGS